MLEPTKSNRKNKLPLILSIAGLVLICLAAATYYFFPQVPLITPILKKAYVPDVTPQLSEKLSTPPPLDYSQSTSPLENKKINYLVYNPETGHVYFHWNSRKRLSPASFTKLMTTQVALDLAQNDPLLTATKTSIDKEPTVLGLKVGEQLPLSDLVRASIATSANDAAATIGEGVARIYDQDLSFFIKQMNEKAKLLNMNDTHFRNPEGYDEHNQYSTLEDLNKLVHNVKTNYPTIIDAGISDREDIKDSPTHGFYYLPNWNGLLGVYPGVTGLKIAYTENAGYSTIVTTLRDNIPITVILTGADKLIDRDNYAAQLLDLAFDIEGIEKATITEDDLKEKYDIWNQLAAQIRAELEELENQKEDK